MLKRIKHHWLHTRLGQNQPSARVVPGLSEVNLIGAPDDRGVLNVGGRLGAGRGPEAIRHALSQMMLGLDGAVGRVELHEGFDVELGPSIGAGHNAVRRAVASDLKAGIVPIVLGGGHDYGYPHVGGACDVLGRRVAVINVDAHLDVWPPTPEGITSGSPFYLMLEEGLVSPRHFIEFGIQEQCNDEAFYGYIQKKKVRVITLDEARRGRGVVANFERLVRGLALRGFKIVVSFDLDSIQAAHAPGVSSPQADGLLPAELLAMAKFCGETKAVATVGFFELNPAVDEGQKTAKLAATAVHRFISGVSRRGGSRLGFRRGHR